MFDWLEKLTSEPYSYKVIECQNGLGEKFYVVRFLQESTLIKPPIKYFVFLKKYSGGYGSTSGIEFAEKFGSVDEAVNVADETMPTFKEKYLKGLIKPVREI